MKNNSRPNSSFGPRPGRRPATLSPARQRVLERLRAQPDPLSLAALVRATGLHENTLREHLDGLLRVGLVRRERAPAVGRGRPAWLYEAVGDDVESEYAGLASALASGIAAASPEPEAVGRAAGEEWGRELARDRGAAPTTPPEARRRVVELLDDLGFAPEQQPTAPEQVHLTRCPLLEAAHRHPEVVCAVHLGIVDGALAEHGASSEGSALTPFAAPGSCLLVLPPLSDRPAAPDAAVGPEPSTTAGSDARDS